MIEQGYYGYLEKKSNFLNASECRYFLYTLKKYI